MATLTKIPATINKYIAGPMGGRQKRKVAGYARVSTDHEDQATSYEAQVDYYTNYIQSRDDWEFVSVHADEGISATNTKHREGFNRKPKKSITLALGMMYLFPTLTVKMSLLFSSS